MRKDHRPHFEFEYSSDDKSCGNEVFTEMEHSFKSDVSFSEVTKYINCKALQNASIDNAFGKTSIYFDGAELDNGKAVVNVDNAFGSVVLYIPNTWKSIINIDRSFSNCEIHGSCAQDSENVIYVNGETAFGNVEIYYI